MSCAAETIEILQNVESRRGVLELTLPFRRASNAGSSNHIERIVSRWVSIKLWFGPKAQLLFSPLSTQ